jgi:putative transposase
MVTPQARRAAVSHVQEAHGLSERRACRLIGIGRTSHRYAAAPDRDGPLREQLVELSGQWRRFGYRGLHRLLRRRGVVVNHKRLYRVYREEGLQVRRRRRKRLKRPLRGGKTLPTSRNEAWAMDFVHDGLADGRRIRVLTIVDLCTRESPGIEVATSIPGERVVRVLERLAEVHGLPKRITCDNGPEFVSVALATWAEERGVELDFIEPGKPVQNCFIESFNGTFRDECLNEHWFTSLEDAEEKILGWWRRYNEERPHSSLGVKTPREFAEGLAERMAQ